MVSFRFYCFSAPLFLKIIIELQWQYIHPMELIDAIQVDNSETDSRVQLNSYITHIHITKRPVNINDYGFCACIYIPKVMCMKRECFPLYIDY